MQTPGLSQITAEELADDDEFIVRDRSVTTLTNKDKRLSVSQAAAKFGTTVFNICRISLNGQRTFYAPTADTDVARGDVLRQAIITDGEEYDAFLINGNFFTNTQIPLKSWMTVRGYGHGATHVQIPATTAFHPRSVFLVEDVDGVTIEDLSVSSTHEEVGWGVTGILTEGLCQRISIINVLAHDLDAGFELASGSNIEDGVRLINCFATDCDYHGLLVQPSCEYHKIDNFRALRIQTIYGATGYGLTNLAGNCAMASIHVDGCDNGIQRGNGSNHAHDTATGGSVNHTLHNAVYLNGTTAGFIMSGFAIFGGTIRMINCEGFRLVNGLLDADIVVHTSPGLPGLNYFQNLNVNTGTSTSTTIKDNSGNDLLSSSPANYAKLVIKDCYNRWEHQTWSHSA